jgi:hypothetical protein
MVVSGTSIPAAGRGAYPDHERRTGLLNFEKTKSGMIGLARV